MNTFKDIQKQLFQKRRQNSGRKKEPTANRRQYLNMNSDPAYAAYDEDDGLDYIEDGDITGYAFSNYAPEEAVQINVSETQQKSMVEGKSGSARKQTINKVGYDNVYDDYAAPPHQVHSYAPASPSKPSKEIGLKDISDIALTTLAFLSFGMFILQVLMCITMSKDDASMVVLPMEGTDNDELPVDGNTEEIRRKRRSVQPLQEQNMKMINHLAKRALVSLKAVTLMPEDGGSCHYFSLCENNKFSRRLRDSKRLWIPAWSLGISWLTMNLNSHQKSPSKKENRAISSLRALVYGLNDGNCSSIYMERCRALYYKI